LHERRRHALRTGGPLLDVALRALCASALVALACAPVSAAQLGPTESARVSALATRVLAGEDVPGLSIAIVRDGRLAFARGYGLRDRARALPARADTRYEIGSVTKTLVAALALQLVAAGALSLDDTVAHWLPSFGSGRAIRVRDLLDQRSGLEDYNTAAFLLTVLPAIEPGHVDRAAIVDAIGRRPLAFAPGTRFEYSNANYLVLGAILERASGLALPALLQRRICGPLGMRSTALGGAADADDATGYTAGPLGPVALGGFDPQLTYAAGGVRSTVTDLARFDVALAEGRVIPRWALASVQPAGAPGSADVYHFGTFVARDGADRILWHDGTVLGFKAMNLIVPESRDAVVVLANADYARAPALGFAIAHAALATGAGTSESLDGGVPRAALVASATIVVALLALVVFLRRRRRS
jgi:D-alanyl-D-alanine carboxypeptidase